MNAFQQLHACQLSAAYVIRRVTSDELASELQLPVDRVAAVHPQSLTYWALLGTVELVTRYCSFPERNE